MPCRYVIDVERRLVVSTGWDRVTFAEMKAHQDKLANDPDFNPKFDQFVDATAVTVLDASPDQLKTLISREFFSPTSRRALLASSLHVLGLARVMEMYATKIGEREQVRLFHDRALALQWLGLEKLPR
jgi:hypothetical protein